MTVEHLKGFISEEVAKYHLEKLNYKVVPVGREKIEPELSDILLLTRNNLNHATQSSKETFEIFEQTISKLPDYLIWKIQPNQNGNIMTIRFIEVKYRASVANLKKHHSEDKYSLNITAENDKAELQIHKYIKNLLNLYKINGDEKASDQKKIDQIEFYVYLITPNVQEQSEQTVNKRHEPLLGKIHASGYSDFYTYLYSPAQINNDANLKQLWGKDYKMIADFFTKNAKLDNMFKDEFLIPLIGKTNAQISKIVFDYLEKA